MTTAAIPTIGQSEHLPALVAGLLDEGVDWVWLLVNRPEADVPGFDSDRVARVDLFGQTIYQGWNWAIRNTLGPLAILNDDIALGPGALGAVAAALASDDQLGAVGFDYEQLPLLRLRYTTGTYRHHGISGCAFMVDAARCPLVDEQFEWWGGDDDLMYTIAEQGGRMGVLEGAHVLHWSGTTARNHPWINDAVVRDRERMLAKWGEAW